MDIGPTPEFLLAFEEVFGTPATPAAVLGAIRAGDPRVDEVRRFVAEMAEDQLEQEARDLESIKIRRALWGLPEASQQ